MALAINNNFMAANTARNLNIHYGKLQTSTQRLSSGLRVNSAADDAAGLAIRELMRADVAALNQGVRNANDAISMIEVVDGALAVIDEKLIRMKELVEQAATGTYNSTQRLMIDSEFQAMASEINRIAKSTDFNGIKLIDSKIFESDLPEPIHHSFTSIKIDTNEEYKSLYLGTSPDGKLQFDPSITTVDTILETTEDYHEEYVIMDNNVYKKITTEITEKTTINSTKLTSSFGSIWQNGWVGLLSGNYKFTLELKDKNTFYEMGIPGTFTNVLTNYKIIKSDYLYEDDLSKYFVDPQYYNLNHTMSFSVDLNSDGNEDLIFKLHTRNYIRPMSLRPGYDFNLTQMDINDEKLPTDITVNKKTTEELIKIDYKNLPNSVKIHFGPMNDSAEDYYYIEKRDCTLKGLGIEDLSIETQDKAQNALASIDDAIVKKDQNRAYYGAMQNRLENTITNLSIQAENLQASESRISDVDVATEMTNFVRNQILTQSAVAMLSQANVLPQMVMQLLRG